MMITCYNRPPDPICDADLASDISTALGTPIEVVIYPDRITCDGDVSESDRTVVEAVIDAYVYYPDNTVPGPQGPPGPQGEVSTFSVDGGSPSTTYSGVFKVDWGGVT